jgi:hypothetical protein
MTRPILHDDTLICPVCYCMVWCPKNNIAPGHVHLRTHIKARLISGYEWDGWGHPIKVILEESTQGQVESTRVKHRPYVAPRYTVPKGQYMPCTDCNKSINVTPDGNFRRHPDHVGMVCPSSGKDAGWLPQS